MEGAQWEIYDGVGFRELEPGLDTRCYPSLLRGERAGGSDWEDRLERSSTGRGERGVKQGAKLV